ncbi:MAG TPA: helix-turn-helix domain-containing protein [Bdellovibrionales bacterium]|nr:helix-turn-helix domain-containing protein [Bdellovibrionales bacterium]
MLKKLAENNGNISKTAEVIGLERSHLHRKIKSYGIDVQ